MTDTNNGFDWNAEIFAAAVSELGAEHYATRVMKKIMEKGFGLLHFTKQRVENGFAWGRSSHGKVCKTLIEITFENEKNEEFTVLAIGQTIIYYGCNPYDRAPRDNGKEVWTVQAVDATKKALGWKG